MLTDEQLKRRHEYIGGSDVPIIMGVSKFKKPWALLLEKSQIKENNFGGNLYSYTGSILEPRIQEALNLINVDEVNYIKEHQDIVFECHIDGLNENQTQIQEIKVSSQTLEQCYKAYEWQIRTYMYTTEIKEARLILLRREGKLKEYINYIINYYQLGYLHDFNNIDPSDRDAAIQDLHYGLEKIRLSKKDIHTLEVKHDINKEKEMLERVSLFWEFKKELDADNSLHQDEEFINRFNNIFK